MNDNLISLDGPTDLSYTEDVTKRFEAYHWHVQMVDDGNDLVALEKAILAAKAETTKPLADPGADGDWVRLVRRPERRGVHGEALGVEAVKGYQEEPGLPGRQGFLRS